MGWTITLTLFAAYLLIGVALAYCARDQILGDIDREARNWPDSPHTAIKALTITIAVFIWPFVATITFDGGDDEI